MCVFTFLDKNFLIKFDGGLDIFSGSKIDYGVPRKVLQPIPRERVLVRQRVSHQTQQKLPRNCLGYRRLDKRISNIGLRRVMGFGELSTLKVKEGNIATPLHSGTTIELDHRELYVIAKQDP